LTPDPKIENVPFLSLSNRKVDTLRLDQIHPIVSGNKWYKLHYYIKEAKARNYTQIASFGGPYSNHLVALAFTARENGLKSIGYVRSNKGEPLTPSLQDAQNFGMQLVFLGRTHFQESKNTLIQSHTTQQETYFVDEGGYGILGAMGASSILNGVPEYDYIICAVGTGTMFAGIINAVAPNQIPIGIPILKNEGSIQNEIDALLIKPNSNYVLLHQFHQGGYAKTNPAQINFMNALWDIQKIPTDIVYTGKVFFAVQQLMQADYFKSNSSVLIIHSGGLQGNRSLAKDILHFGS
jgi:1-aminocyclopropane-1-carboxylate deaminase